MLRSLALTWRYHLLALCCYVILALIVTYPMPLHLNEQIIANEPGRVDGYLGIWNIWWTARAITTGQSPFFTPLLFYPQGLDLFWQTLSVTQGLLALPITLIWGPLPAYNILILLSFILSGYFTFLFILYVCRPCDTWPAILAAIVGGAVYAYSPFHLQKVLDAQLEVASIQWVPLWALTIVRFLEQPSWKQGILCGVALLWVGLGTWYYGLFSLITTGLMIVLWSLTWQPRSSQPEQPQQQPFAWLMPSIKAKVFIWGLAPIGVWFLVMLPRLISMLQTGDKLLGDARGEKQAYADIIGFFLPNPNHPWWRDIIIPYYNQLHPDAIIWNVALGLVGTAVGIYGASIAWRTHWRWLVIGIFAAAMSLGAQMFVWGWDTGLPGPYALIRDLPGVRTSHRPNHFVIITLLVVALFAAIGTRIILARLHRMAPVGAMVLLAGIIGIDGWAGPMPLFQRPISPAYLAMPQPDGALLPIPLHLNIANSEHLWYQTYHHWPIIGGFIGREPPYPLGRYAPGIKELRFGRVEPHDILAPSWPELARETLAAYKLRYVIFHHQSQGETLPVVEAIIADMGLTATYRDELITIYPVPTPTVARPLAYLGEGWGRLETGQNDQYWRWMGERAHVYLLNPTDDNRPVRLFLEAEALAYPRELTIQMGDSTLATLMINNKTTQRELYFILPPGETLLTFRALADRAPDGSERWLSLSFTKIEIR